VTLRLHRLCSTDEEFDKQAAEYERYLELHSYNSKSVTKVFSAARSKTHDESRLVKGTNSIGHLLNLRGPE